LKKYKSEFVIPILVHNHPVPESAEPSFYDQMAVYKSQILSAVVHFDGNTISIVLYTTARLQEIKFSVTSPRLCPEP